jgi:murein DD-endopeptidase MepM/ murein hydrolase activator NlpD
VCARIAQVVLFVLLALLATGSSAAAEQPAKSLAKALGVRVLVPGGGGTAAFVSAPPAASASAGSYTYVDALSTGAIETSARATSGQRATSTALASVTGVSLFGGEISVGQAVVRARAFASGIAGGADLLGSSVSGVQILGSSVVVSPNRRVPLADWGYAVLLEQAVVAEPRGRLGKRVFASAVHVHLTAAHGGLPAGTDITIGYAEAFASAVKTPVATTTPDEPESPAPPNDPVEQPPGANPSPPPAVQSPPSDVKPELTAAGYVFPVYGPAASFTDDFGAARADTGWHHGNDIFAPIGTPLLAVADGTLFSVGVNSLGGNRLWLRDRSGNEFYYAHLSAFSPLAEKGAAVKAGDVVGFVGATGDAVGTPPHLHFEIHPAGLLGLGYDGVVNPYEYLVAWRRLDDLSLGLATRPGTAPPPGAVLLEVSDISSTTGLDPEALARTLEMSALFGESLGPAKAEQSSSPGFSG